MEEDFPSKNKDGKLPILDLKVWVSPENIILHEFYRKDMSTRIVMMSRSAMPKNMKRSALTQEGIRILKNCSEDIPWERIAQLLSDFSLRMKISGYNERYRHNIIQSSLLGWEKQKENDRNGIRPLYREKNWNRISRQQEKEKKSTQWYKEKGEYSYSFPIFCPQTPNSKLLIRWKRVAGEVRKSSRGKVNARIVEQAGTSLRSMLSKSSPKEDIHCHADDCYVCTSDRAKNLVCRKTTRGGVGYEAQCKECAEEGRMSLYHGETSRTLYARAKEHLRPGTGCEDKPLIKHTRKFHPGKDPAFDVRAVEFFQDPLTRQINEGVRINNSKSHPTLLMNSKSEYIQGAVPRVVIMQGLQQ